MKTRTMLIRGVLALAALVGMSLASSACGDDDDEGVGADSKEEAAVRTDLEREIAAERSGDAETVLKHVTDTWLANVVGANRDEVKADPALIQTDNTITVGAIKVSGTKAAAAIKIDANPDNRLAYGHRVDAVKEGGVWKLDVLHVTSAANLPSSARTVKVGMTDYAFDLELKGVTSKDDLVFRFHNRGKKYHMVALSKIPRDADLDALLQSEGTPAGVEDVGAVFVFAPGDKADVVLTGKLTAGRYVMLCFIVDPDDVNHESHLEKGMKADFITE